MNTPENAPMQAYIANLSAYNSGYLIGKWVDIDEDIQDTINGLLEKWGVEEYAVHDYDNVPAILADKWGEWPDWDEVLETIEQMEEHGENIYLASLACGTDVENYIGCFESLEDWGREHLDETGFFHEIPETIRDTVEMYFDFKAYARDQELNGGITSHEASFDEVYIFYS